MLDRRKHVRYTQDIVIELIKTHQKYMCQVSDLSIGGICFVIEGVDLEDDDMLTISLNLNQILQLNALVKWTRVLDNNDLKRLEIGVEFINVSYNQQLILEEYCIQDEKSL